MESTIWDDFSKETASF